MTQKIYVGINNVAKNVNKIYVGTNNVARKVIKGYVGDSNNIARLFYETKIYTPLNYIESSGTQWINTGISPNANTCTEIKARFPTLYVSGITNWVCFTYLDNSPNRYAVMSQDYSGNTSFIGCQTTSSTSIRMLQPADTNWHTVIYNNINHKVLFDNVEKGTCPTYSNNNTRTLTLFCRNEATQTNFARSCQLEYCKIYDTSTNTMLRDFIPVLDSNNVACLFDKVTNTFFYNQGTGTFNYG